MWLNFQRRYDEAHARAKESERLFEWSDWLKKFHGRIVANYDWNGETWQVIALSVYVPSDKILPQPEEDND